MSVVPCSQIFQSNPAFGMLNSITDMKTMRAHSLSELLNNEIRKNAIFNDQENLIDPKPDEKFQNLPLFDDTTPSHIPESNSDPKKILDQLLSDLSNTEVPSTTSEVVNIPEKLPERKDEPQASPAPEQLEPIVIKHTQKVHETKPSESSSPKLDNQPTEENGSITKMRIKISMHNNDNNDTFEYKKQLKDSSPISNLLDTLWKTTIPVLVKNNKVSVHPRIEYDDMSKVLPEMPLLLNKISEVHRPGHVTVIIMNPKNVKVDRDLVRKTKICCEFRHILIGNVKSKEPSHPEPFPVDFPSDLQKMLDSLLKPTVNEAESEPSVEDERSTDDIDSPWSTNEKNIVSSIMNNLHLFYGPEHISAISFNPKHIMQKKNPKLVHIRIKISSSRFREKAHHPASSGLEHFFDDDRKPSSVDPFESEEDPRNVFDNDLSPNHHEVNPELIHLGPQIQQIPFHLEVHQLHHQRPKVTVNEFPLRHFLDDHEPLRHLERPKKTTLFYFVLHHRRPEVSPASNLHTLLQDIFNIPQREDLVAQPHFNGPVDIPQAMFRLPHMNGAHESVPLSFHHGSHVTPSHHESSTLFNDFFHEFPPMNEPSNAFEPSDEEFEDQFEPPQLWESLPHRLPPTHGPTRGVLSFPRDEPSVSDEMEPPPLGIFKMFNTQGMRLFPHDQFGDPPVRVTHTPFGLSVGHTPENVGRMGSPLSSSRIPIMGSSEDIN